MAEHGPQRSHQAGNPQVPAGTKWRHHAEMLQGGRRKISWPGRWHILAWPAMGLQHPTTISRTETTNGSDHMSTKRPTGHPGATHRRSSIICTHRQSMGHDLPGTTFPGGSSPFPNCFENEQLYFKGWMMMDESDQK